MSNETEIIGLCLAAGKGTRMKSDLPKVLHEIGGRPMVLYVTDLMSDLGLSKQIVVVGYKHELVEAVLPPDVDAALQAEQNGTGHAVQCAAPLFLHSSGTLLLLYGDVPLLRKETLLTLIETHNKTNAAATMLTVNLDDPAGYGRVVRGADGGVLAIVEHKDADEQQRAINEINTGIYCFQIPPLLASLDQLKNDNAQGEYYVTDCVGLLREAGHAVAAVVAEDPNEVLGVNNLDELDYCGRVLEERRKEKS